MKVPLKISIGLNLGLLGGLIFVLMNHRKDAAIAPAPVVAETRLTPTAAVTITAPPPPAEVMLQPFRWRQLESKDDYRVYVANLRAAGCPEPTVRDIVRGDTERAFSFERGQLGLDDSGNGTWSRSQESRLMAELLGDQPSAATKGAAGQRREGQIQPNTPGPAQNLELSSGQNRQTEAAETSPATRNAGPQPSSLAASDPSYPLAFQTANLDAMGLTASQKAAIPQAQQQFANEVGNSAPNPSDPASLPRWAKARNDANNTLLGLMGAQTYMAFEQQLYYQWYQPQVLAANGMGQPLTINPDLFSR